MFVAFGKCVHIWFTKTVEFSFSFAVTGSGSGRQAGRESDRERESKRGRKREQKRKTIEKPLETPGNAVYPASSFIKYKVFGCKYSSTVNLI